MEELDQVGSDWCFFLLLGYQTESEKK